MISVTNDRHHVWAIVLMYGNEEATSACLQSLMVQDHEALNVLLVDNKSHDGCAARLRERFPKVHYLDTGGNLGYTGGMNRGIAHALANGADDVLVLNNDTTLERNCVSELVEGRKKAARPGMVAPKILYFDPPNHIWYGGGDLSRLKAVGEHRRFGELDRRDHNGLEPVSFASGCAFLMPAAVARDFGGFAEDFFMYCEDVELSLRLQRAGYGIYYQPAARVYHRDTLESQPRPLDIRMRDRNRRRIARRHYSLWERALFAGWFYPTRVIRFGQYVLRGDWERARAIVAGVTER